MASTPTMSGVPPVDSGCDSAGGGRPRRGGARVVYADESSDSENDVLVVAKPKPNPKPKPKPAKRAAAPGPTSSKRQRGGASKPVAVNPFFQRVQADCRKAREKKAAAPVAPTPTPAPKPASPPPPVTRPTSSSPIVVSDGDTVPSVAVVAASLAVKRRTPTPVDGEVDGKRWALPAFPSRGLGHTNAPLAEEALALPPPATEAADDEDALLAAVTPDSGASMRTAPATGRPRRAQARKGPVVHVGPGVPRKDQLEAVLGTPEAAVAIKSVWHRHVVLALGVEGLRKSASGAPSVPAGLQTFADYARQFQAPVAQPPIVADVTAVDPKFALPLGTVKATLASAVIRRYCGQADDATLLAAERATPEAPPTGMASLSAAQDWPTKYRPTSAAQVCGNQAHVGWLLRWLASWKQVSGTGGTVQQSDDALAWQLAASGDPDSDYDFLESESEEGSGAGRRRGKAAAKREASRLAALRNAVMLCGPSGCGKTAAVHACAAELGYAVIEMNASTPRGRKQVLNMLGEATQSRRLVLPSAAFSVDDQSMGDVSVSQKKVKKAAPRGRLSAMFGWGAKQKEEAPTPAPAPAPAPAPTPVATGADSRQKGLSIIVFEEVDILFEDDAGFAGAIQKLISFAKCPVVLTCNVPTPAFHSLGVPTLAFSRAPINHVHLVLEAVCFAEGLKACPKQLLALASLLQCDLRRLLLTLQLWGHHMAVPSPLSEDAVALVDDAKWLSLAEHDALKEQVADLELRESKLLQVILDKQQAIGKLDAQLQSAKPPPSAAPPLAPPLAPPAASAVAPPPSPPVAPPPSAAVAPEVVTVDSPEAQEVVVVGTVPPAAAVAMPPTVDAPPSPAPAPIAKHSAKRRRKGGASDDEADVDAATAMALFMTPTAPLPAALPPPAPVATPTTAALPATPTPAAVLPGPTTSAPPTTRSHPGHYAKTCKKQGKAADGPQGQATKTTTVNPFVLAKAKVQPASPEVVEVIDASPASTAPPPPGAAVGADAPALTPLKLTNDGTAAPAKRRSTRKRRAPSSLSEEQKAAMAAKLFEEQERKQAEDAAFQAERARVAAIQASIGDLKAEVKAAEASVEDVRSRRVATIAAVALGPKPAVVAVPPVVMVATKGGKEATVDALRNLSGQAGNWCATVSGAGEDLLTATQLARIPLGLALPPHGAALPEDAAPLWPSWYPAVSSVVPSRLDVTTGGTVTVYGSGFTNVVVPRSGIVVKVGGQLVEASTVTVVSDNVLQVALLPRANSAPGPVDIVVVTNGFMSSAAALEHRHNMALEWVVPRKSRAKAAPKPSVEFIDGDSDAGAEAEAATRGRRRRVVEDTDSDASSGSTPDAKPEMDAAEAPAGDAAPHVSAGGAALEEDKPAGGAAPEAQDMPAGGAAPDVPAGDAVAGGGEAPNTGGRSRIRLCAHCKKPGHYAKTCVEYQALLARQREAMPEDDSGEEREADLEPKPLPLTATIGKVYARPSVSPSSLSAQAAALDALAAFADDVSAADTLSWRGTSAMGPSVLAADAIPPASLSWCDYMAGVTITGAELDGGSASAGSLLSPWAPHRGCDDAQDAELALVASMRAEVLRSALAVANTKPSPAGHMHDAELLRWRDLESVRLRTLVTMRHVVSPILPWSAQGATSGMPTPMLERVAALQRMQTIELDKAAGVQWTSGTRQRRRGRAHTHYFDHNSFQLPHAARAALGHAATCFAVVERGVEQPPAAAAAP